MIYLACSPTQHVKTIVVMLFEERWSIVSLGNTSEAIHWMQEAFGVLFSHVAQRRALGK